MPHLYMGWYCHVGNFWYVPCRREAGLSGMKTLKYCVVSHDFIIRAVEINMSGIYKHINVETRAPRVIYTVYHVSWQS